MIKSSNKISNIKRLDLGKKILFEIIESAALYLIYTLVVITEAKNKTILINAVYLINSHVRIG